MRKSIRAVVLGATAVAVACATETECDDYCGTIVVLNSADASTLFPPNITLNDELAIVEQIHIRLAELTTELETAGDSGFVPELATRWIREDSVTLVFELNPEARWHDGTPVTADDVAFSFNLYRNPEVAATSGVLLERIESATARDDQTVVFRFTMPYLEQLYDAVHHMWIMPKHVLDTVPPGEIATHPMMRRPIGAGPYRVADWGDDGTIELVADTNYFLGRPGIRRVIFRTVGDFGAKVTALASGDGDFVDFLGPPSLIERIEQSPEARVVHYSAPLYSFLGFNFRSPEDSTRPHPLFGDPRVRRALSMVLDRDAINQTVTGGYGTVAESPIPPMVRVSGLEIPTYSHDTAAARDLLREAGWTDSDGDGVVDKDGRPFTFEMIYPSTSGVRRTTAIAMEEMFRNAGLDAKVNAVEISLFQERQQTGEFDTFIGSQFTSPSPRSVKTAWGGNASFNYCRYNNPAFDAAVRRAENTMDTAVERQAWLEAFRILYEDAPAIWLYHLGMNAGVHNRFEDVTIRSDSWGVTLWKWRVRAGEWEPRDLIGN